MKKTGVLALTLTIASSFQPTKAVDWDLALKTASLSAIAPTICALIKAPKNRTIIKSVAATCCALSSVTSAYYAVLLDRSNRTSDKFLSFTGACFAGFFGGFACRLAEDTYTEYQQEKAIEKYWKERAAEIKAQEEQAQAIQNDDQAIVSFGADPQI